MKLSIMHGKLSKNKAMRKYYITDQEIEQAKKMLRDKGFGWQNGKYTEPPKEYKTLEAELSAMEMIHSFLAYHSIENKDNWKDDYYFRDHLKVLGAEKLQTLIDLAVERLASVDYAGTDGEGNIYNSVRWKD